MEDKLPVQVSCVAIGRIIYSEKNHFKMFSFSAVSCLAALSHKKPVLGSRQRLLSVPTPFVDTVALLFLRETHFLPKQYPHALRTCDI